MKTYLINCIQCGKEHQNRRKTGKFCSQECSHLSQKGKCRPHTKEHEDKRLQAVRKSNENRIYKRGYKRAIEHIQPMIDVYNKLREENPEKYREIDIKNLPKNNSLEHNGNWRGGKTKENKNWRIQNSGRLRRWRKKVLERDKYVCRECGSKESLEAHHIIPLSESKITSSLLMNGVTLCKRCHIETDSYAGKGNKKTNIGIEGNIKCIMRTIPHNYHEYPTVGNYKWVGDTLIIFVSDMKNDRHHMLVFLHEYIEANLCKFRGISEQSITDFDIFYEMRREMGFVDEFSEPGDSDLAPYQKEHQFSTMIEKMLAKQLRVNWQDYEEKINEL